MTFFLEEAFGPGAPAETGGWPDGEGVVGELVAAETAEAALGDSCSAVTDLAPHAGQNSALSGSFLPHL